MKSRWEALDITLVPTRSPIVSMCDTMVSLLTVHLDSPISLVEQIRLGLRRVIAAGELRPGDALPTVRQLANDLAISLNTVSRAYRLLEAEGLIATVRGRGTVVMAALESPALPNDAALARLSGEIRNLLVTARLAGLDLEQTQNLMMNEAQTIWPTEE